MTDLVIIPLLPFSPGTPMGSFFGKSRTRDWTRHWENTLPFAEAGVASWKDWSSRNGIRLEVSRRLPTAAECRCTESQIEILATFPPTIQRWLLPLAAWRRCGDEARIAMVDADTLISPQAPSIFEQAQADVILTPDRPEWNAWRVSSLATYAPMFPDIEFDKDLFFNAGVMVLGSPILPRTFLDFVLDHAAEYMARMTQGPERAGTDQIPLNFIFQKLARDNKLTASLLDSRWNARVDLALEAKNPDRAAWTAMVKQVILGNHISHFVSAKELMPAAWQSIEQEYIHEPHPGRHPGRS